MDKDGKVILENTYKKVETDNVVVTFKESDAPSYTLSGLPLTLEAGKDFTFKILTNATTKYESSAFTVTVSVKNDNVKTIEDCVRQLGFQLGWKDQVVSNDINLPTSVNEFEGATVVWKSKSAYLTDAGKIIKRDIVNVTAEMEATVSWNGNTKKTTFNVSVERLKKIREIKKVNAVDWTYTVDFSQDNVLKYLEKIGNNSEMTVLEFEIKEVNSKDQILVAELKRKSVGQDLLTCEEFISSKVKQFLEAIDREFSSQYFALKKNDNPQWEDIHNYLVSVGFVKKDASLIDSFTTFKQLSKYQGTQEDFVKCPPSEKKTYIIAMLDEIKSIHCERDDVPTDTSDDKLVETLKKAVLTKDGIPAKHHFKVWKYKYTLNKTDDTEKFPDGYSFDDQSIFDESKEW